ncbi:TPA: phage holin family protein, partial [Streptococcus pyogenes]
CYGISIVENWGQLGLPMPSFVRSFFEKLKRDTDQFDIATIKIDKTGVKVEAPQVDLKQKEEE